MSFDVSDIIPMQEVIGATVPDYWCIVAIAPVSEEDQGYPILWRSPDASAHNLLPEASLFECIDVTDALDSLPMGIYRLQLGVTGSGPDINGEYESEVYITKVTPLVAGKQRELIDVETGYVQEPVTGG